MKKHTQKFRQHRKFLLVVPLLVAPFLTMAFWALGGGQGAVDSAPAESFKGLNLAIPEAQFAKIGELWDKLGLYEQAQQDSMARQRARRNDPYYQMATLPALSQEQDTTSRLRTSLERKSAAGLAVQEQQINEKLASIQRQMSLEQQLPARSEKQEIKGGVGNEEEAVLADHDLQRMEQMMGVLSQPTEEENLQMEQMDRMLDKILDIQHPERMREQLRQQSIEHKQKALPVMPVAGTQTVTTMDAHPAALIDTAQSGAGVHTWATNAFYGLQREAARPQQPPQAIEAVVHARQTVTAGATVKLRLLTEVYIHGRLVKKGSLIHGVADLRKERLTITITSLRDGPNVLPVALSAYDMDGMEGVYIPGAMTREVAKQAATNTVQELQWLSMDNNMGTQAAGAGVEAVKGLLSKKAKQVKVTLQAGYRLLLIDNSL